MNKPEPPFLEMRSIEWSVNRIKILDKTGLVLNRGEIHALLGENGAGKSSLMKILFGLYTLQKGSILLEGKAVNIHSPKQAHALGISMIHQELPFASHLTVAQNMFLGREILKGPLKTIDESEQNRQCKSALQLFPESIEPDQLIGTLSIAQRQIVAIATALDIGARLIVMDEATTALSAAETKRLFGILKAISQKGTSFIFITHKMDEVFQLTDRVTVMRDGKTVFTAKTANVEADQLVEMLVGPSKELSGMASSKKETAVSNQIGLQVIALNSHKLTDISFKARKGEILGVAGLMGAGRTSLFNALFGADRVDSGRIVAGGKTIDLSSPARAIEAGFAYVTEDRKATGLALLLNTSNNITLTIVERLAKYGWISDRIVEQTSQKYQARLSITGDSNLPVSVLSGGNQQKVVLAKWLASEADIYLLDEPTRGIDVGTKQEVYALIRQLKSDGKTVLLATSELPELLDLSDRILVLVEGKIEAELDKSEATATAIMSIATGVTAANAEVKRTS